MSQNISQDSFRFMNGGGEAGAHLRAYNWKDTPLGDPATWPECICTAISICLNSSFPISVYWGADYYMFYNEAYIDIAGDKHPSIMGKPRKDAWAEVWEEVKTEFDAVFFNGVSARTKDRRLVINRFGFDEECYFDYALSPIVDAKGNICGVFNAVIETTQRLISERRNYLLQQLGYQSHSFQSQTQAYHQAITLLEELKEDIPFSLLYSYDLSSDNYALTQSAGITAEQAINIDWPLKEVISSGIPVHIGRLKNKLVDLRDTPKADLYAAVMPVKNGEGAITGLFVAGLNPSVRFDHSYQQFLGNVAYQLGIAINNGAGFEKQKLANDRIKYSEDQLQFAIDAAELGTWDLDPLTSRFSGNHRIRTWFGLPADAEIDLSLATAVIAEPDRQHVIDAIQDAMTYSSGGHYEIEYTIINPLDPVPRIVKARGKALFNEEQQVTRFSGTLQDITAERKALESLENAYEQSRLSKEAAQLGSFDMDLIKGTMEWDERCRLLFGISHHHQVTYEDDFLPGLHPDDKEKISLVIDKAFIKSETNGNYDVEYRTVGVEDQQLRWVRAKGKVFFNELDEPVRFIGSVLEITDQKQNEIRKNDFIGMVSHELKTPLTSLKAYVQVLNARAKKEENNFAISALNKVELQVNKMGTLISGFLDVSRLESGRIYLNMKEFNLDELISEIIDESTLIIHSHEIKMEPCECIEVYADRDKIGQVITNLISNAVKYSPRGQLVEIICKRVGDNVQVSVRDEGMGIRTTDKDRLFDRFYRVESTHTQNISGFGIGLYISAEIIRRHRGQIWVDSEKGVGSTFFFNLPL